MLNQLLTQAQPQASISMRPAFPSERRYTTLGMAAVGVHEQEELVIEQLHAGHRLGGIHQLKVERLAAHDTRRPPGVVGTRRRLWCRLSVHEIVLEAGQRMMNFIALQVRTVPAHDAGLQLAQLLAELADCEIDRLVLIDSGDRGAHVMAMPEQGDLPPARVR